MPRLKKPEGIQITKPEWEGEFTINDTISLMSSPDHRARFVAEYVQLKVRYEKLKHLLTRWEAFGQRFCVDCYSVRKEDERDLVEWLGFRPSCSFGILRDQQQQMGILLHTLELRAAIEGIDLRRVVIKL